MTDAMLATAATAAVDAYFAVWNETEPARRRAAITVAWTDDARYLDPMFSAEGADGIDGLALGVQTQFPGYRFRQTSPVDVHHDRARWGWELVSAEGVPYVSGVDYALLSEDGRLREVTGFFEPPVAQPAA
jgi:hypothetical protein